MIMIKECCWLWWLSLSIIIASGTITASPRYIISSSNKSIRDARAHCLIEYGGNLAEFGVDSLKALRKTNSKDAVWMTVGNISLMNKLSNTIYFRAWLSELTCCQMDATTLYCHASICKREAKVMCQLPTPVPKKTSRL